MIFIILFLILIIASPAFAEPFSVGITIISALGLQATATTATIVGAIALGALGVAGQLLTGVISSSLAGRPDRGRIDTGQFTSTFTANEGSEIIALGRMRIGGLIAFGNTNAFDRYRLICHSRGVIDAVEEHILGGRPVVVEDNGDVSSPPYARPNGSYINIQNRLGEADHMSFEELKAAFPDLWTDDHRLRGIAQSMVKYVSPGQTNQLFPRLYSGGEPEYTPVIRGVRVFDPRKDDNDFNNPETWEWSDNGVILATYVLTLFPHVKFEDIDWDLTKVEADKADALVPTLTGMEKRSTIGGAFETERERNEVLQSVLKSAGCELVRTRDGKYYIRLVEENRPAEIHFEAKHIISVEENGGPEAVERDNVARVEFLSPERNYRITEVSRSSSPWATIEREVSLYGEKFSDDLDLPFCTSASQAQRIGRRLFVMGRAETGVLTLSMVGILAFGKQTISYEDLDTGEPVVVEVGLPSRNQGRGTISIPFVKQPYLEPWDPQKHESMAPEVISEIPADSTLEKPEPPTDAHMVFHPDGTPELRIFYDPVPGSNISEVVYRIVENGRFSSLQSTKENREQGFAYDNIDLQGQAIEVRHRYFDRDDEGSPFSEYLRIENLRVSEIDL